MLYSEIHSPALWDETLPPKTKQVVTVLFGGKGLKVLGNTILFNLTLSNHT